MTNIKYCHETPSRNFHLVLLKPYYNLYIETGERILILNLVSKVVSDTLEFIQAQKCNMLQLANS